MLKKGASLLAWLDRDSTQVLRSPARATLSRMIVPGHASGATARLAAPIAEATFYKTGAVQLAPLPAGVYVLSVTADGFAATHAHPIEVEEGLETILRRPIRLERPLNVRIEIAPSADPHGAPWTLSLKRRSDFSAGFDPFPDATAQTDERGAGTIKDASPGECSVFVRDSRGNRLFFDDWSILDEASAARHIDIPAIDVRGTVTLAKKPVAATVSFGGTHGAVRVQMTSDEEGKFRGSLPRAGRWKVAVRDSGKQTPTLVDVDVPEDGDVTIELPDTTVSGVVLDSGGKPVDRARVTLFVPGTALTARTDSSGQFVFHSVPFGRRTLLASDAGGNETSDHVNVEVTPEAATVAGIELKLLPKRAITGQVVSRGNPVVGARVRARPVDVRGTAASGISDTRGAFRIELRDDARRVNFVVTAAGHALHAFEMDTGATPVVLELTRNGGALVLKLPETFASLDLRLNGIRIPSADVFRWTDMLGETRRSGSEAQRISNVVAGSVQVCITRETSGSPLCRSGQLAAGGSLQLDFD